MAYKALRISIANYAAPVWSTNASESNIIKIQRAQNEALRIATDTYKMPSMDHLHSETEMLHVKDHLNLHSAKYLVQFLLIDANVLVPTLSISGDVIKPTSGDSSKRVGACNTTIPHSRHAISKLNVRSSSPSRQKGMKSIKFDTPMIKDFLRKQVKLSQNGSPVCTHSRINSTPSDNQFIDVTQDVESNY